jgi:hypothetical protein
MDLGVRPVATVAYLTRARPNMLCLVSAESPHPMMARPWRRSASQLSRFLSAAWRATRRRVPARLPVRWRGVHATRAAAGLAIPCMTCPSADALEDRLTEWRWVSGRGVSADGARAATRRPRMRRCPWASYSLDRALCVGKRAATSSSTPAMFGTPSASTSGGGAAGSTHLCSTCLDG